MDKGAGHTEQKEEGAAGGTAGRVGGFLAHPTGLWAAPNVDVHVSLCGVGRRTEGGSREEGPDSPQLCGLAWQLLPWGAGAHRAGVPGPLPPGLGAMPRSPGCPAPPCPLTAPPLPWQRVS